MNYSYDPSLSAGQNYQNWQAGGSPTNADNGQQYDVRGAPIDPNAWAQVFSNMGAPSGANQNAYGTPSLQSGAPAGASPLGGVGAGAFGTGNPSGSTFPSAGAGFNPSLTGGGSSAPLNTTQYGDMGVQPISPQPSPSFATGGVGGNMGASAPSGTSYPSAAGTGMGALNASGGLQSQGNNFLYNSLGAFNNKQSQPGMWQPTGGNSLRRSGF